LRNCKLIAIDIDGTLLTPTLEITSRTRDAIQAAQSMGIIVTLATARRYPGTHALATELGIELPLIIYDGALVLNHPSQTILSSQKLSGNVAQQVVEIFHHHHVQPVVQHFAGGREEVWTGPAEFDNPELAIYFSFLVQEHTYRMPYSMLCTSKPDPLRVVAFASEEAIQAMLPAISQLDCSWNMLKQGNYNTPELAIMHPNCSKASGVAVLAAYYHIPMEEIMAIGDNYNDLEMLQAVGWGVAMGQAPLTVQAAAKAVTATNQEEGVALAIERYALMQHNPVEMQPEKMPPTTSK
jgi:Cof subfamily protein (haloacid dehalogenase superfamily)